MVRKALAVLRYNWQKNAGNANTQAVLWNDTQFQQMFKGSGGDWSLADYLHDATLGIFDLSGGTVFPWRTLKMDQPTQGGARSDVFQTAIKQALNEEKVPLNDYAAVVVFLHPPPCDAGAASADVNGANYVGAVLDVNGSLTFYAEEVNHALMTFDHSWGPGPTGEYGDPYCGMSAWTFGGTNPTFPRAVLDATVGTTFWSESGPLFAAAMLQQYIPEFAASASVAAVDGSYSASPKAVTLTALSDASLRSNSHAPGSPALAAVPAGNTTLFVEYRRQHGWDQGIDGGVRPGTAHVSGPSPTPGVVIHRLDNAHVTYVGAIPVPTTGQGDWNDTVTGTTVEIASFDPGAPERVTVRIGGPALHANRRVELAVGDPANVSVFGHVPGSETFARPKDLCPIGTYNYDYHQQSQRVRCHATSFGVEGASFVWSVDGNSVASGSHTLRLKKAIIVPHPHGPTTEERTVEVTCDVSAPGNLIDVYADGGQGVFVVNVTVVADEGIASSRTASTAASAYELVRLTTEEITFEEKYTTDLYACLKQVQQATESLLRDTPFHKFIDKGDPPGFVRPADRDEFRKIRAEIELIRGSDEKLAQQYAQVASRTLGVPEQMLFD